MRDEDLLATCWTTAGNAAPLRGDERSPIPLRERIELAAAAGFRGFGLNYADLVVAEREYGLAGIRSMFQDNDIVHIELELLADWWSSGPPRERSDAVRRDLLSAAEALDAHHVKLRAEKNDDSSRTYTITVTCTDAAGNKSLRTATVVVPHNQ